MLKAGALQPGKSHSKLPWPCGGMVAMPVDTGGGSTLELKSMLMRCVPPAAAGGWPMELWLSMLSGVGSPPALTG